MIGLTKARIDNLIDFNEECIRLMESLGCGDSDLCFTHKIALMALKSSAVGSFHIYDQKVDATTDYVRDGEWPIDNGEILVYAAPPVVSVQNSDIDCLDNLAGEMLHNSVCSRGYAAKAYAEAAHKIALAAKGIRDELSKRAGGLSGAY